MKHPEHPIVYEINTWIWLHEMSQQEQRTVTLASVPEREWNALARLGPDMVWLMGVWERSPAGVAIAMDNPNLQADFRRALPDFSEADVVGSPYCVRNYQADPGLGGPQGLAVARRRLAERGIGLLLDFVPNHVAPDHPWVFEHPEYFLQGNEAEAEVAPQAFQKVGERIFAYGKDPFFPAWPDVLQLNAFSPGLRGAVIETLSDIGRQCDGVRCDMSMLVMNRIFQQTWGGRAGNPPANDYWPEVIASVRREHPDFLFMAEAYWDLEWELQQQGFDYCYDKRLYDRLVNAGADDVRGHLHADMDYQSKLVRFLENHDEPRASATFPPEKLQAAVVTSFTLPGALLVHEGQLEGHKIHVPVFLARRPEEKPNENLHQFYDALLQEISGSQMRRGTWQLCHVEGWPDNQSNRNLVAWCWDDQSRRHLIVVNLSPLPGQGRVQTPWDDLSDNQWTLSDFISGAEFHRDGSELTKEGLFVDLAPWSFHCLRVRAEAAVLEVRATG